MTHWLSVVLQTPAHSAVAGPLTYQSELPLTPGMLVRVPFGTREVLGVVWGTLDAANLDRAESEIRAVSAVLDGVAPLPVAWRQLVQFTAGYYQRSLGEVALAALPPQLRDLSATQLARRLKRASAVVPVDTAMSPDLIALSQEQITVIDQFDSETGPFLLFGATGSGKTEVYLRCVQALLELDATA
ncbi:MAG: primosomal protein N', partial [Rhodoferax sp.]